MFTTPLRSENMPPIAPKTSGVAKPSVCAISVASKTESRFAVLERVARMPRPIPRTPAATAPQPSRRRPRVTVQIPSAAATMPTRIGQRDRPRLDRRDGEERRERTEQDPERAGRAGSRSRALSGFSRRADHVFMTPLAVPAALAGGAAPHLLAGVPDVEDQDVGADEEDDQALDDVGEVARQLGSITLELPRPWRLP